MKKPEKTFPPILDIKPNTYMYFILHLVCSEFPLRPQGQILRLRTTFSFTQETKCIEMKYIVQREKKCACGRDEN